jgi:hypothetical protein
MSLWSGLYKGGLRVAREAAHDVPTLMDNFGIVGRVSRPGNSPGWSAPTRLEARMVNRAYKAEDAGTLTKTQDRAIDNFRDHMEHGEAARAYATSSMRTHIAQHLKSKGIKHEQKNTPIKGMRGKGNSDWFNRFYSPRGGDLEPGHYTKTNTSKKDLLARQRRAAAERKAGSKGGMR